jgi:hypothetical protein
MASVLFKPDLVYNTEPFGLDKRLLRATGHTHSNAALFGWQQDIEEEATFLISIQLILTTSVAKNREARFLNNIPGYEVLYLGMKFCTWVWNFEHGYEFFVTGHEVLNPGMKFCTRAWSFVPGHEVLYPGMKFSTWVLLNCFANLHLSCMQKLCEKPIFSYSLTTSNTT